MPSRPLALRTESSSLSQVCHAGCPSTEQSRVQGPGGDPRTRRLGISTVTLSLAHPPQHLPGKPGVHTEPLPGTSVNMGLPLGQRVPGIPEHRDPECSSCCSDGVGEFQEPAERDGRPHACHQQSGGPGRSRSRAPGPAPPPPMDSVVPPTPRSCPSSSKTPFAGSLEGTAHV